MDALELLQDQSKFKQIAQDVFESIDQNENGKIEFSEMKKAVLTMYDNVVTNQLNDEEIDSAIEQLDKDQNQQLSLDELSTLLRQILKQSVPEYNSDNEKNKSQAQTPKSKEQSEPTSFRKKKVTLTREEKLQELQSLKKEFKELKQANQTRKQLQNQRIVNVYLNPKVNDEELKQKQDLFDSSSNKSSISSKSSISLNPLVLNQNIRQGFFKNAEDVVKAASVAKNNHLIGMAVKRISAGDWQGLVDYFNEQTDNEFDRTPSSQQFHTISKKLSKNVKFILIHIQNLTYTNFKDLRVQSKSDLVRTDQPALFYWEVVYNGKSYFQNSAKELTNQLNECLDSVLIYNYINPIEVILWKKQGKEALYVGQFDITPQIFQIMRLVKDQAEEGTGEEEQTRFRLNLRKINKSLRRLETQEIKLYKKKRISYVKKEQEQPFFGEITAKFQMFEIFEYDAPINQLSNVVGSPRSLDERTRRRLVEESKYGPYKWPDDQKNKALVININEAGIDLVIVNEEDVQAYIDGDLIGLIKDTFHIEIGQGGSRQTGRQRRVQLKEDQLNLLKSLDEFPLVVEIDNLRKTIRQGRVSKKDLEAALQAIGSNAKMVFIDHVDDLGFCEYDYCFDDSNYSVILDTVQNMEFTNPENINEADIFAEKLVRNLKNQLLNGDRLEPLYEFLKAAEKVPDFGVTINLIADQFNNGLGAVPDQQGQVAIDPGALISYFDINSRDFEKMENYEHVMILGKLLKLSKKHLYKDDPFLQHLQENHDDVKTKIYFTVPVLPKKMQLKEKAKLLTLMDDNVHIGSLLDDDDAQEAAPASVADVKKKMREKKKAISENAEEELKPCLWNICHELARRKRWKMFFDGFSAAPEFYYQKDASGNAPLIDLFETGPFSVINQMINRYHPSNPNEDQQDIPKFDVEKMLKMTTKQGKSFIHALVLNQSQNPKGQLFAMKAFFPLIDPDTWKKMLVTPMKPHDGTPLTLFINRLANSQNDTMGEDQPVIKEILQILKEHIKQDYTPSVYRVKQLFSSHKIEFENEDPNELTDYYYNHIQLTKAMAQLQPSTISLVQEEITWLEWFGLNIEKYNGQATDMPYAIYNLARQGKLELLEKVLTNFSNTQNDKPCTIQPNLTFIISKDQEEFLQNTEVGVSICDKSLDKIIEFSKEKMIEALSEFYTKYPLEALIGIKDILTELKFSTQSLNKLIDNLILSIIKQEPRILAKQFYIKKNSSPYEDLVKLGFEDKLKEILSSELIEAYYPKKIGIADSILQDGLQGKLKDKEEGLQLNHKQAPVFYLECRKMMTEKKVEDVLIFLKKIEQDKIEKREQISIRLAMQIVQALPNSFSKQQYPKIFKMLKTEKQLKSQQLKPLLNAALESNNGPLINNTLLLLWNKEAAKNESRMKGVLRPMFQKYGQQYKSLMYHPAVILNQADFKKYMEDTKELADFKDYEIAAKELIKYGQSERLPLFIKKLAAKKPEVLINLLEDYALKRIEKELTDTPVAFPKPLNTVFLKNQPQYIIPTKRLIILSQMHLIDAGAIGALLNHAKKMCEKQPNMPKSWNKYNNQLCLQAFQQQYSQKLRSSFISQRPANIFNNWSLPQPDYVKTIESILNELNDQILDDLFNKKSELKTKLEKAHLLPLVTSNIQILNKLDNPLLRRFNSIEKIVLMNLKQKATDEQIEIIAKRTNRNLEFLSKYFNPELKAIMEQEKKRTLRIIRALEVTLKRGQNAIQLQFAVDVVLIIVKQFQLPDFQSIIESNQNQIFNAFSVCLMRSKTEDQRALDFMGTQLNNYKFYDFVSSLAHEDNNEIKQGNKKTKKAMQLKAKQDETKVLMSVDSIPEKSEIEEAQTLVVPSQNNVPYILKLLKAKVKPFFKNYTKDVNFVNGEPFNINDLKKLTLFEYLIVKCHYTLIQKHYAKVNKPKNQLTEDQITRYLCLASSSGSYKLFELITKDILNMDFPNLYKNYEVQQDLQKYLDLPIFYQVIMMSSEQSAILYFDNIITNSISIELFYKWLQFEPDSKWNCFVPIINKKYSLLFTKIIIFLKKKFPVEQQYKDELLKIFNFQAFVESKQASNDNEDEGNNIENLTLLEYSILQGFPDLSMCMEQGMKLLRDPFEGLVYDIISPVMIQCGYEFKQDDAKIKEYISKYQQDAGYYKVKFYQTYLAVKQCFDKYEGFTLTEISQIKMYIALFNVSIQYISRYNFVNSNLLGTIEQLNRRQNFVEQFKSLHFSRFDKVQQYKVGIVDYLQQYYPQLQQFWILKEIHQAFKTYLNYDFRKGLKTMNKDNEETIMDNLDDYQPEVQFYILYNNPEIFINQNPNSKLKFAFFSYKYLIPLIRFIASGKENKYAITEQILIEDVDKKYQFAAIIIYYISSGNDTIIYVGETDPKANKIFLILEKIKETLTIKEIDILIVQMIQSLRSNQFYEIVKMWSANDPGPINKDIYQEKSFIQGVLNFLNKYKKTDKINCNYKQNDFLKLLQMEFVKNDKLYKDKIYRGLCIIHIMLNFVLECENLSELIESDDQVQVNLEIVEQSKVKNISAKTTSISDIKEGENLLGYKFILEIPLSYQERNNVITLFFHNNTLKEFEQIIKRQHFENEKSKEIFEYMNQKENFVNSISTTFSMKKSFLTLENHQIFFEELEKSFSFNFGQHYKGPTIELTVDENIFVDGPSNYVRRKQLSLEDELAINWYFDHKKYLFQVKLNIIIMRKDQMIARYSRESQLKLLMDDYIKNVNQKYYIDKFLSDGNVSVEFYLQLKKQKEEMSPDDYDNVEDYKEALETANELIKKFPKEPLFSYYLDWPIYIENNKVFADEYNFPQYTFNQIIQTIEEIFQHKYIFNYWSIIDTFLIPILKMFELGKKSQLAIINLEDIIYQILDWPLLKCVIQKIGEQMGRSSLIFEMKEGPKPEIAKNLKLTGIDDSIQLSQTKYYLHRGLIIARLGIYFNKKSITLQNRVDGQNLRFSQNFQINDDITPYFNFIINEAQMQSAISTEEQQN